MTPRQNVRWAAALLALVWGALFDVARPCIAGAYCTGDCDGNGAVATAEAVDCRGIAFGSRPLSVCTACDCDQNGSVSTDEALRAERNVLDGCNASECPAATTTPGITPTSTATRTVVVNTPTRTPTGTQATATVVPSSTSTIGASPTVVPGSCVGDCDQNGQVLVNEVVIGVNITLERAAVGTCPSFDTNGTTTVSVDELVRGVNNLLRGCLVD